MRNYTPPETITTNNLDLTSPSSSLHSTTRRSKVFLRMNAPFTSARFIYWRWYLPAAAAELASLTRNNR
jgi:hypothetical protein